MCVTYGDTYTDSENKRIHKLSRCSLQALLGPNDKELAIGLVTLYIGAQGEQKCVTPRYMRMAGLLSITYILYTLVFPSITYLTWNGCCRRQHNVEL